MKTFVELVTEIKKSFDKEDNSVLSNIENNIELTSTATLPHAVGTYLIYNKVIYEVTAAIATGDTLTPGTNITVADDIMAMIEARKSEIQSLTNQVKGHWSEGGKNLLPFTLEYAILKNKNGTWSGNKYTIKGITFTLNDDGSVTVNGTHDGTSGAATLNLFRETNWTHEAVVINGAPSGSAQNYCAIEVYNHGSSTRLGYVSETNPEIEIPTSATNIGLYIHVWGGQTVSNLTFYPMIRLASIADDTYEPYAKTNQQLTKDTTALLDNTEVNGAVNILPNNATSQVVNGITFTVNDDKTVTVNGTATASTEFVLTSSVKLGNKAYKVSGCPSGGSHNTYKIDVQVVGGTYVAEEVGKGYIFTASSSNTYKIRIRIIEGTTVSNLTFKPMITVPSYNGDYVPYAKSNKELTEDVAELNDFEQLPSDLITASDSSVITNLTVINSYKYGHIAIVNFEFKSTSTNLALNTGYMAIKNGYRPKSFVNATLTNATNGKAVLIGVWTNGGIQIQGNPPLQNETVRGSLVYFI